MTFRSSLLNPTVLFLVGFSVFSSAGATLILPQQQQQRYHITKAFVPPSLCKRHHHNRRWCKDTLKTNTKVSLAFSKRDNYDTAATTTSSGIKLPPPLVIHHTALKTRNITTAIEFYSLLGFQVTTRFRAGPARAAWLELGVGSSSSSSLEAACRLELIEVPSFVLQEPEGMKRRAIDLMDRQEMLGHNHIALDVTDQIIATAAAAATTNEGGDDQEGDSSNNSNSLITWIQALNQTSISQSNRMLRVALLPQQQMIGKNIYELAFLYDADGALVELLNKQAELEQEIKSGWEPWDVVGDDFDFQQQP